ncbi:hypothetical protein [Vibrio metschnikovii]|uniref:hypothetical protein n=1 Tax=Vibrio metschnikovii TaxID=28172 RepID=UPI001C301239|nr:hypothetical protein [Vibrio metschnikovii]
MPEMQSLIVKTNLSSYSFSITPGGLLLDIGQQILFLIDKDSIKQYAKEAHSSKVKSNGFFPDVDFYELKHENFGIMLKIADAESLISMINKDHWSQL